MGNHGYFVYPKDVDAFAFDWGRLALTVAPEVNGAKTFSGGVVDLPPGQGHTRHNHPGSEEIIFVISGHGEQMVEDENGKPANAEGRARLHDLRAGKPFSFDAQHRRRADAAFRGLFACRSREAAARTARFPDRKSSALSACRELRSERGNQSAPHKAQTS